MSSVSTLRSEVTLCTSVLVVMAPQQCTNPPVYWLKSAHLSELHEILTHLGINVLPASARQQIYTQYPISLSKVPKIEIDYLRLTHRVKICNVSHLSITSKCKMDRETFQALATVIPGTNLRAL